MINLAGHAQAEVCIRSELSICGVPVVTVPPEERTSVRSSIGGKSGNFRFIRATDHWIVFGNVPLAVAEELYKTQVGRKDIHANGSSFRPDPRQEATWFTVDGKVLAEKSFRAVLDRLVIGGRLSQYTVDNDFFFTDLNEFSKIGIQCVPLYRIYSQEGLNMFMETLRNNRLV